MKNIDDIDYRFIEENCPKNLVPALLIKTPNQKFAADLFVKIKRTLAFAECTLGRRITRNIAKGRLIDKRYEKNEYVIVYYMTPEEKAVFNTEKHRLMYFGYSNPQPPTIVCCSFDDKNEPIDTLTIPLGEVRSDKDVPKILDNMRKYLAKNVLLHCTPLDDNSFSISFSAQYDTHSTILSIKKSRGLMQAALLNTFENSELTLCDINGNNYPQKSQQFIVDDQNNSTTKSWPRKLFLLPEYLAFCNGTSTKVQRKALRDNNATANASQSDKSAKE